MELYKEYLALFGKSLLVFEGKAYAVYYPIQDGIYIEDIYVRPEFQRSGIGKQILFVISEIAKEKGLSKIYGTVKPSYQGSTASLDVQRALGFKLKSSANDAILLEKEI